MFNNFNCFFIGSSYEGRRKAAKRLARLHFKSPVAIHPEGNIYSFPTQ
ncbi:competence protein ComK [Anaerobacillus arseniciselenatis]